VTAEDHSLGNPPGPTNWPALSYETRPWQLAGLGGAASRSQLRKHQGPYQAAVPAIIQNLPVILAGEVSAASEHASLEIARFDAEMGGEIAPFASVLLRSESAASSQIENLTASARAIAEAELGPTGRRNAAQIVANVRAMDAAVALADQRDADSILAMHHALMIDTEPAIAGRWRETQVWIGGGGLGPHGAKFVPPHHTHIAAAINDLVAFMRRDDVPVLAHAAIAHAQFETIHPFPDGNGRTGRALLHSMLRSRALTRNVTVPISAGLLIDTAGYFDALGAYRRGDPAAIVDRMSDAAVAAVANGRTLVTDLRAIRASWNERLSARRDSKMWQVTDLLTRHPVINAALVSTELNIAANHVYRYIEPLAAAGVLTEFTIQKRNRAWRTTEILDALDAFAARVGRRNTAG
jgi:Fic family protein